MLHPEGAFVRAWGSEGGGPDQLNHPQGLAISTDGTVFVADMLNGRVQLFDRLGRHLGQIGRPGGGPGELRDVHSVALDRDGSLYATDSDEHGLGRVQRFARDGSLLGAWGEPGEGPGQLRSPTGVAVAPDGSVYVVDSGNCRVQRFDRAGRFLATWGEPGEEPGRFRYPAGIAVDDAGLVYVVDARNRSGKLVADQVMEGGPTSAPTAWRWTATAGRSHAGRKPRVRPAPRPDASLQAMSAAPHSECGRYGSDGWRDPRRHLGLALCALARQVLSRAATAPGACLRLAHAAHHRAQRLLLFAAAARVVPGWHDETPEGFVFAVKGSRYITHMLRLKDVRTALANFLASGVLALRAKLGPMLWQLPPSMAYEPERLEDFFSLLPRDTSAALALARRARRDGSRAAPGSSAPRNGRCGTRWKCAIRASSTRASSPCCAGTASRWWSPTRPDAGRCSRT